MTGVCFQFCQCSNSNLNQNLYVGKLCVLHDGLGNNSQEISGGMGGDFSKCAFFLNNVNEVSYLEDDG